MLGLALGAAVGFALAPGEPVGEGLGAGMQAATAKAEARVARPVSEDRRRPGRNEGDEGRVGMGSPTIGGGNGFPEGHAPVRDGNARQRRPFTERADSNFVGESGYAPEISSRKPLDVAAILRDMSSGVLPGTEVGTHPLRASR